MPSTMNPGLRGNKTTRVFAKPHVTKLCHLNQFNIMSLYLHNANSKLQSSFYEGRSPEFRFLMLAQ